MSVINVERVGAICCTVGESPVWDARQGAWLWVDIPMRRIWRLDAASGATRSWNTPEMTACIALTDSGAIIAGMESGIFSLALGEAQQGVAQFLAACVALVPLLMILVFGGER